MDKKIDILSLFKKHVKGKVAVFIDAANILYSQKDLGWKIDYSKLKKFFKSNFSIYGLFYYTGKVGAYDKQIKFLSKLKQLGYHITAKEVKFIKIKDNKFLPKGNLDVELALDAYRLKNYYQTLILMSGDSDFAYLLDLLVKEKKQIIVISTRDHISKELLERGKYIDLPKLKAFIEFKI